MTHSLKSLASVAIISIMGHNAHATDTDDAAATEAAAHFKKGSNAYRAGDLDEAVAELKAAVKLKPTPNGIFALGQALREKGDLSAAAHEYRQYLTLAPTGSFADKSRGFLSSIEATLTSARKTQIAPPQGVPPETPAPSLEPKSAAVKPEDEAVESPVAVQKRAAETLPREPSVQPGKPLYKKWWLWTVVSVVATGTVVGIAVGATQSTHSTGTVFPASDVHQ